MRMIEADNVQPPMPRLLLDADQLTRRNLVTIVSRVGSRILSRHRVDHSVAVRSHVTQQDPAALVRISLFSMSANPIELHLAHAQHRDFTRPQNRSLGYSSIPAKHLKRRR